MIPPANPGAATAIAFAQGEIGDPYRWGGSGPDAWDCSGLTSAAYAAAGYSLSHSSRMQYAESTPITADQLQPGDLLFWSSGSASSIYHVAIYLGGTSMIHAPRTGRTVGIESWTAWRAPDLFARVG